MSTTASNVIEARRFEAHDRRTRSCPRRGCDGRVIWFSDRGRAIAVEASSVDVEDAEFDRDRHEPHVCSVTR